MSELVSSSQHKQAIDLLLEYLEVDPYSSILLRLLVRTYTLDNQPDKAGIYQIRFHEAKQASHTNKDNSTRYKFDDFSDDDMAFTQSQVEKYSEEDYIIDVDGSPQLTVKKEPRTGQYSKPPLSIGTTESNGFQFKTDIKADSKSRHANPIDVDDNTIAEEKNRLAHPKNDYYVGITAPDLAIGNGSARQPSIDETHNPDCVECEGFDLIEKELLFSDELFEDYNDNVLDELAHTSFPSLEESSEDLAFDDFEDLDEFDELAHQETEEEVQDDGKISREARARQIAVEVLDKSDWDLKHLSLLQQIFIENGWSAARRAIEREIGKGLWPEELSLARRIRLFWLGNEQCWMTFHKIKHNAPFQQTDAAYKCMSWPESLRIIRCFPSLPDIEEIYMFIDGVFDHWYNSKNLGRIFPAFFKFLKYRVDSMCRALPGETVFSFLYYMNASFDVDTDMLNNSITTESQELLGLGLQLNQWPRPPENKMKIIGESDE